MKVGIIGCGPIGRKRALARGRDDLVGGCDVVEGRAAQLAAECGGRAFTSADDMLELAPDVVVVAVPHNQLAGLACLANDDDRRPVKLR